MSMTNPLTPAGIEPATFRFVAQHPNHCATAVPTLGMSSQKLTPPQKKHEILPVLLEVLWLIRLKILRIPT